MKLALFLVVAAVATARAQSVDVQLRERGSNAPVVGAVVRLLLDNTEVTQALTNASGRVVLRATDAGIYRLRVSRIGFRAVTVDSIVLAAGETLTRELTMSSTPFTLPAVAVQTKSQCGTKLNDGAAIAAVWEQIATALSANVLTQTQWKLPLNVQRFRRNVTLKDSVFHDLIVGSYIVHGPPFGATDPIILEKQGYVSEDKGSTVFSAPDAQTVLSDGFVTTHCFRMVPGATENPGTMGLAFEPVPYRRLPEVKGTLWIDQASSELRSLDYTYTNLHNGMERVSLGGRVDFKRLETGAWIVSHWYIRMPKIHVIPADVHMYAGRSITRPEMREVDYFIEEGGRVTVVDATFILNDVATLIGVVTDSTTNGGPLEGAVIKLMGEPDSAVTDSSGRYRLTTKNAGTQRVTISHPKLGLISDSSLKETHLSLGASTRADFVVPAAISFVREFCGDADRLRAGLVGRALSAKGEGLEGYDIRVSWAVGGPGGNMGQGKFLEEHAESGPGGIYVICTLPPTNEFTVRVQKDGRQLGRLYVRLETGDYKWVDVKVAPPPQ